MDQVRHKAEVLEVYADKGLAAVKFYCSYKRGDRIECVVMRGLEPLELGTRGWVTYTSRGASGWEWVFSPFKDSSAVA